MPNKYKSCLSVFWLAFGLTTFLFAQETNHPGIFDAASDVGNVAQKGSVAYDSARGEYRVTGGGANIWAAHDDFYFLWRKLSGDAALTATVRFEDDGGAPHRKVSLMFRKSLDAAAPHVDATVHANGLTVLEYRETTNDITRSVRFPVNAPVRLRLERKGNWFTMSAAAAGQPLSEAGAVQVNLGGPVYVGLAVCPHDDKRQMTVIFSDVKIEAAAKASKGP